MNTSPKSLSHLPNDSRLRLHHCKNAGLTLLEVLVVIVILVVLVGLFVPAMRPAREAARRMSCSNNFRQIGLAIHNYHSAYEQLPMQMGGTYHFDHPGGETSHLGTNGYRLSFLVGLAPFMEASDLWERISSGDEANSQGNAFQPMGPAPWAREFAPWQTDIQALRCPSDPGVGFPMHGRTNYAACLGDATEAIETGATRWNRESERWVQDRVAEVAVSGRGMFVPRRSLRFRDILDGLSNTIMAGEIVTDAGNHDVRSSPSFQNPWTTIHLKPTLCEDQRDPERPRFWSETSGPSDFGDEDHRRGARWADGAAIYTSFFTVLPPNRETCVAGDDAGVGPVTVSSRHTSGAHLLMGDGAVIFITDSIECGISDQSTVRLSTIVESNPVPESPYGLWGALGTRAASETIEKQINQ